MTPSEKFRFGFLASCVEQKLSPEAAIGLAKVASDMLSSEKKASNWTTALLALAAPPVAAVGLIGGGAYLGSMAGEATRKRELTNPVDVKDVQKQELVQSYKWHTNQIMKELAKQKQMRLKNTKPNRRITSDEMAI